MDNYQELIRNVKESLSLAGDKFEEELQAARRTYEDTLKEAETIMSALQKQAEPEPPPAPEQEKSELTAGIYLTQEQVNVLLNALASIHQVLLKIAEDYK